ncbi:cyclic nucleotide-binding domain-containing protein [Bauldia sp.]|uniref:cyclic nucleotide-binding domain-containing protein n=1 Tax=Bauldia sp. TaxID=2575872 RepID=UPI003BAA7741
MLLIERVAALHRVPIFAELYEHTLAEIAQIVEEVTFEPGEEIIREGAMEDWMFVLVDGRVQIDIGGVEISILEPGAAFGELAILDPAPRAATVTALESSLLFRIGHQPFRDVMHEQPEVMAALLVMLTRMLRASRNMPSAPLE